MGLNRIIYFVLIFYFLSIYLWPYYIDVRIFEHVGLNPQRLLIVLLLFLSALFFLKSPAYTLTQSALVLSEFKWFYLFAVVYFVIRFLSISTSDNFIYSLLVSVNDFILLFIFSFLVLFFADNRFKIRLLFYVFFFSSVLVSIYIAIEFLFQYNFFESFTNPNTKSGEVALFDKSRDGVYRAQGVYEHPITQAQLLVSTVIFCYYMINKNIFWLFMPIISIGIYFTGSRFGQLSLFIFLALVILGHILRHFSREAIILVKFVFLVLALGGLSIYILNFSEAEMSSSLTRVAQIFAGWHAFLASPFIGHGPGLGGGILFEYSEGFWGFRLHKPSIDNYFLSVLVESGVLAFLFFILMLLSISRLVNSENNQYQKWTPAVLLTYLSFSGFFILSIFHLVYFVILAPLLMLSSLKMQRALQAKNLTLSSAPPFHSAKSFLGVKYDKS